MALNKVNLVRVKSGEFDPPQDGDLITYDSASGLYLHTREGDLANSLAPNIESSAINNDAGFYNESSVPVRNALLKGEYVLPGDSQTLDLGNLANTDEVLLRQGAEPSYIYNGAYSQHWVSADDPIAASGKDGDLWFKI